MDSTGTVRINGDDGPGLRVRVSYGNNRLRLTTTDQMVGDWPADELGIHALNEGFAIRAEGEEFILVTDDDAALAEEMGILAASPRLARKLAARHKTEGDPPHSQASIPSFVGAVAFALSGALMLVGGTLLRSVDTAGDRFEVAGVRTWVLFSMAGVLIVGLAYLMTRRFEWTRMAAIGTLAAVVALFAITVASPSTDATRLAAYGLIAGGVVVGVAALFGGALEDGD